jgi:hypothetical protein
MVKQWRLSFFCLLQQDLPPTGLLFNELPLTQRRRRTGMNAGRRQRPKVVYAHMCEWDYVGGSEECFEDQIKSIGAEICWVERD